MVMSADRRLSSNGNLESIFGSPDSTPVSDELRRLTGVLATVCPKDSVISFVFDRKLHVHVDLRRFEDMTTVEGLLPTICGGIFQNVRRGMAERHSFFHRLTADVQC